jgi:hypothetical protein
MEYSPFEKHRDNVRQLRPDCLHVLGFRAVVHGHFDGTTIGVQTEMSRSLVMRKSHCLITLFLYIGLVLRSLFHVFFVRGARLHVLRCQLQPAEH